MRVWQTVVAALFLGLCGCSYFACESPIEKERRELVEAAESTEAVIYRGLKVSFRATEGDPSAAEVQALTTRLLQGLASGQQEPSEPLTAAEYVALAKAFYELRDKLREVDEDEYPTILERLAGMSSAPAAAEAALRWYNADWEHLILAMLWVGGQKAPPGFVIYEMGQLDPDGIDVPGVRVASRLLRSAAFFQRGWPYLTDLESTAYLQDLEASRGDVLAFTREFGGAPPEATDDYVYAQWHAPGVLVRGLARHKKGEEDEALDDFDAFLTDAETLGIDDEGVWLIGAYVGIKREDKEKALTNLRKLETSELLGDAERKLVSDAIEALEGRDPDSAFNKVTDKVLVARIASAYVVRVLGEVDWREELERSDAGRALLKTNDVVEGEVQRIKGALSPEQLDGLKQRARDAATRIGSDVLERAGKALESRPRDD